MRTPPTGARSALRIDYYGRLDVSTDGDGSQVTVSLHSNAGDDGRIDQGMDDTLTTIARLVEAGPVHTAASA